MERYFSMDVLVDILKRLPPSSRRQARLVCRHWRHLADKRTTEMQSRAKPLTWDTSKVVAYIVDSNLSLASTETYKRTEELCCYFGRVQLVGSCNGLICVCSNQEPGGAIAVFNPVTGEKLTFPRLRSVCWQPRSAREWDKAYSFGYHSITGRYTLVHVPCSFDRVFEFDAVHVLTLGKGSWREVPVIPSGTKCNLSAGIISIDGTTHWVTEGGSARIMCFDLKHERITTAMPLPVLPAVRDRYHLTEVHGRLGFVVWDGSVTTDAWVLEKKRWSRWYSFRRQDLPWPHFAYGEYVMTRESLSFYIHRRKGTLLSGARSVVSVGQRDKGTLVAMGGATSRRPWAAARALPSNLHWELVKKQCLERMLMGQKLASITVYRFCPGSVSGLAPPLLPR